MKYQLQLEHMSYMIEGGKWFEFSEAGAWADVPKLFSGEAIIYLEHDLLWIGLLLRIGWLDQTPEPFEDFEAELKALPRWEATRYVVVEAPNNFDEDGRILNYALFLYDCRTGQRLLDQHDKPVAGRETEVARLRRGIEQLMRGESFSIW
jgi:hypothetical protein